MKQTRRGFLGALLAGAAAVASATQATAEAAPSETKACAGCDICTVPTFEAMVEDCAARGCSLERTFNIYYLGYTYEHGRRDAYQAYAADRFHLYAVDAWRRGLHA